jgi:CheY-like chemotaxis protein
MHVFDLNLPGMSGLELVTRVRGDQRFEKVPILALTASASKSTRDECLASGFTCFLSKPVRYHDLIDVVRRFVD